ncbi:putative neural Wiskott-Aldrich syndrome protein-like isoform X1 [Penaeus vannamei]|uniref:Putative neural Wiskott-Aldrich syndrome protein-like isoform X1 n=1 Tax=Penaeus vannamei TaxID=6689 RepID=A0A3R7MTK3_PENVA|nr:putative neural Wiskott-Aldrich syndrome protein-like isoform X1 [Penaeus vannamei]
MYGTEPPHHSSWYKIHCGVATFTKDNIRKSFFIQVYDFATGQRVFEQEIYREFSYHDSRPHFHQFESDEKMIGFNFADETDSKNFHAAVSNLLLNRKKKREERMRQGMQKQQQELKSAGNQPALTMARSQETVNQPSNNKATAQKEHKEHKEKRKFLNRKGKDKKKNLRKHMIGEPTNFLHVSHAGFDRDHNFSQFNVDKMVDDELKDFFRAVGLKRQQMEDPATRQFVYDFINKAGGLEEAKRENQNTQSLSLLLCRKDKITEVAVQVHGSTSAANHPPPPPLPSGGLSSSADPRSALLHQIQEGKNLRKVDRNAAPAPPLDSRGQLLEDIKSGVRLRKVEAVEAKEADPNVPAGLSGMALDLHRALQERFADKGPAPLI